MEYFLAGTFGQPGYTNIRTAITSSDEATRHGHWLDKTLRPSTLAIANSVAYGYFRPLLKLLFVDNRTQTLGIPSGIDTCSIEHSRRSRFLTALCTPKFLTGYKVQVTICVRCGSSITYF